MTPVVFHSTGSPTPTIHWSKLRSPLPWQHRLEGDTLIIPRVAQQDSGQYICNATSPTGHAEATIALHVESKELICPHWAVLSALYGALSQATPWTEPQERHREGPVQLRPPEPALA